MSVSASQSLSHSDNVDPLDTTKFDVSPVVDDVVVETVGNGDVRIRVLSHILEPVPNNAASTSENIQTNDPLFPADGFSCSPLLNPPTLSRKRSKTLADFELLKVLGRGAYGKVFLVRRPRTGELLAMKVMRKREVVERNVVNNIKSERATLANVNHPFIVKLRYAFQTEHKLYLLMSYVGGGEMFTKLDRDGVFIEKETKYYAAEVALALNYLHERDIIYRDLKPENVLFTTDGHVCLTDFGFAKQYGSSTDESRSFCGSMQYLAPEIVKRTGHGKAADWWTLGCLIFEMMTTRTPFGGGNRMKIQESILNKKLIFPKTFSQPLQHLLKGLLNRDAEKRYKFADLKKHAFFMGVDWDLLEKKLVVPPFVPTVTNEVDVSNFDERFTVEPVVDSPVFGPNDPSSCLTHPAFRSAEHNPANPTAVAGDNNSNAVVADLPQAMSGLELGESALPKAASSNGQSIEGRVRSVIFDPTVRHIELLSVPEVVLEHDERSAGAVVFGNCVSEKCLQPSQGVGFVRGAMEREDDAVVRAKDDVKGVEGVEEGIAVALPLPTVTPSASETAAESAPATTTTTSAGTAGAAAGGGKGADLAHYTADDNDDRNVFKGFDFLGDSPYMSAMNTPNFHSSGIASGKLSAKNSGAVGLGGFTPRSTALGLAPPKLVPSLAGDSDDDECMHFTLSVANFSLDSDADPTKADTAKASHTDSVGKDEAAVAAAPSATQGAGDAPMKIVVDASDASTATPISAVAVTPAPAANGDSVLLRKMSERHHSREGLWHHNHQHQYHHFDYHAIQQQQSHGDADADTAQPDSVSATGPQAAECKRDEEKKDACVVPRAEATQQQGKDTKHNVGETRDNGKHKGGTGERKSKHVQQYQSQLKKSVSGSNSHAAADTTTANTQATHTNPSPTSTVTTAAATTPSNASAEFCAKKGWAPIAKPVAAGFAPPDVSFGAKGKATRSTPATPAAPTTSPAKPASTTSTPAAAAAATSAANAGVCTGAKRFNVDAQPFSLAPVGRAGVDAPHGSAPHNTHTPAFEHKGWGKPRYDHQSGNYPRNNYNHQNSQNTYNPSSRGGNRIPQGGDNRGNGSGSGSGSSNTWAGRIAKK